MTFSLPAIGASPNNVIVAGYSSGSYMASQLMIAFPELIACAGMFNGGLTVQNFDRDEDSYRQIGIYPDYTIQAGPLRDAIDNTNYQKTREMIFGMEERGVIGDQQLLGSNHAAYVFEGGQDGNVPYYGPLEQRRYFSDMMGADNVGYHLEQ
jgi:hypothetical protein